MSRPRIAAIATTYHKYSHAQHFADRFLVGYPYEGRWQRPDMRVVSMYVDQRPEGVQSQDRDRGSPHGRRGKLRAHGLSRPGGHAVHDRAPVRG